MAKKPTYEELEQRIKELEKEAVGHNKAVEALRESEKQYKLATSAGKVGLWDWNIETNEIYLDPNLKAMLGYADHEIRNHLDDWGKHVHPDDTELVMAEANAHLEGLKPHYEVVHRMLHKDGSIRWFLARGTVTRDADGKPYRMVGTDTDITERKRVEEALSEANKIINRSPAVAFLWKNEEGWPVEFVSENVKKLFGYSAQEFLEGKISYSQIIHSDDLERVAGEVASYSKKEGVQTFEHKHYRIITKNGDIKWINDMTYIRRDSRRIITHYEGIIYDISERKQAEEQLLRHTEQINKHKLALQKLAKMDFADFDIALKSTTGLTSQSLEAERVCVWLFNEDQSEVVCQDLYQLSHDSHEKGLTLKSKDYPNYFRALKEKGTIAADDAQNDPLTNELTEGYLTPLGITSRLSVAIFLQSDIVGGVSAEHTGPLREWSEEEQAFLNSIADLVTLALEIARRQQTEIELKKYRGQLEELVEGRTAELKEEISERKQAEEELRQNVEDLERFSKLAVRREERMIKLKKEINELLRGLGQPDKYKIVD